MEDTRGQSLPLCGCKKITLTFLCGHAYDRNVHCSGSSDEHPVSPKTAKKHKPEEVSLFQDDVCAACAAPVIATAKPAADLDAVLGLSEARATEVSDDFELELIGTVSRVNTGDLQTPLRETPPRIPAIPANQNHNPSYSPRSSPGERRFEIHPAIEAGVILDDDTISQSEALQEAVNLLYPNTNDSPTSPIFVLGTELLEDPFTPGRQRGSSSIYNRIGSGRPIFLILPDHDFRDARDSLEITTARRQRPRRTRIGTRSSSTLLNSTPPAQGVPSTTQRLSKNSTVGRVKKTLKSLICGAPQTGIDGRPLPNKPSTIARTVGTVSRNISQRLTKEGRAEHKREQLRKKVLGNKYAEKEYFTILTNDEDEDISPLTSPTRARQRVTMEVARPSSFGFLTPPEKIMKVPTSPPPTPKR